LREKFNSATATTAQCKRRPLVAGLEKHVRDFVEAEIHCAYRKRDISFKTR